VAQTTSVPTNYVSLHEARELISFYPLTQVVQQLLSFSLNLLAIPRSLLQTYLVDNAFSLLASSFSLHIHVQHVVQHVGVLEFDTGLVFSVYYEANGDGGGAVIVMT